MRHLSSLVSTTILTSLVLGSAAAATAAPRVGVEGGALWSRVAWTREVFGEARPEGGARLSGGVNVAWALTRNLGLVSGLHWSPQGDEQLGDQIPEVRRIAWTLRFVAAPLLLTWQLPANFGAPLRLVAGAEFARLVEADRREEDISGRVYEQAVLNQMRRWDARAVLGLAIPVSRSLELGGRQTWGQVSIGKETSWWGPCRSRSLLAYATYWFD